MVRRRCSNAIAGSSVTRGSSTCVRISSTGSRPGSTTPCSSPFASHVPPTHFGTFWSLVELCLRPGGRAGFVDEDERAHAYEAVHSDAGVPTARRTLQRGTTRSTSSRSSGTRQISSSDCRGSAGVPTSSPSAKHSSMEWHERLAEKIRSSRRGSVTPVRRMIGRCCGHAEPLSVPRAVEPLVPELVVGALHEHVETSRGPCRPRRDHR